MKKRLFYISPIFALLIGGAQAADGEQLYMTKTCIGCHGPNGQSLVPTFPSVAGQNADYLFNQMRDIKSGSRSNGQAVVMKGVMAGVNEEEMRVLANWLSAQ